MIPRGLLCAALLLASPALAFSEQAAAQSDTQPQPDARTDETSEQPDAGASQSGPVPPEVEDTTSEPSPQFHGDCTPAPRAHRLVGKQGCVSGRVYRIVFTNTGNTRLYLCPKDHCPFHATVYKEDVETVGSLLHLRGRMVAIDGEVVLYHGVPEIKVTDRDQIKFAAGGSHETDVAQPGTIKENRKREVPHEKAW